ncbi:patatin-like phospholipase family protein [Pseudomonas capsici]|uniref:patatin-like phospholipase family protein n=1 Tax=Pseudomonas capsici TaxID=2810614 RepID=UPI000EFDE104|nr:patatin-like phospholipase family protein [Pseudomonas capsici]MCV4272094.1 patatin-like phospholipase family protein [Pseudomonas capsici]
MTKLLKDPERSEPIFLALQGGGAKGVVHVGGLIAIDDLGLDVKGVAGTSAGSMVAALIAAGYKGQDLIDPISRTHIFQTVAPKYGFSKATDLFSPNGWRMLRAIRHVINPKKHTKSLIKKTSGLHLSLSIAFIGLLLYLIGHHPIFTSVILFSSAGLLMYKLINGLTSIEKVRVLIDGAISDKCKPGHNNITFKDLASAGGIPLKIVATNTLGECLELFCLERTPDVVVADAVAASICLPIIFRPWEFSFLRESEHTSRVIGGKFVDGGLMSNLPAWPFDEERLLFPETTTVALGIRSAQGSNTNDKKHWLPSVINAIVSGTGEIHTRAVGKIIKIPLTTKLGMLDFDANIEDIYEEVERSKITVATQLQQELIANPRLMREAAEKIKDGCDALIREYKGLWYTEDSEIESESLSESSHKLRVALGVQRAGAMKSLSLAFSAGYDKSNPDNAITLPLTKSIAGNAWLRNETIVANLKELPKKHLHASEKVWDKIQWVMCIPLRAASTPDVKSRPFVIIIDWTMPIDNNLPDSKIHFEKFAERALESVVVYTREMKITEIVQGANSWL